LEVWPPRASDASRSKTSVVAEDRWAPADSRRTFFTTRGLVQSTWGARYRWWLPHTNTSHRLEPGSESQLSSASNCPIFLFFFESGATPAATNAFCLQLGRRLGTPWTQDPLYRAALVLVGAFPASPARPQTMARRSPRLSPARPGPDSCRWPRPDSPRAAHAPVWSNLDGNPPRVRAWPPGS